MFYYLRQLILYLWVFFIETSTHDFMKTFSAFLCICIAICFSSLLSQAQQLSANAGNDQVTCIGQTIQIGGSPTASGGTGPYTYAWSPATGLSSVSIPNPSAMPMTTTIYTVLVTDNAANSASATVTVTVNPTPIVQVVGQNFICMGQCVTLTASGGTTYQWSTGVNNPGWIACPQITTTYTVTASSAGGCTATDNFTVNVAPPMNLSISSTPASCGLCNGSAIPNGFGGTPPYTYVWSNGAVGQMTNNLCAGIYSLTVTDALGCSYSDTVNISNITGVSVVLDTLINANCSNNNLGSIAVYGECGAGNYSYHWWQDGTPMSDTTSSIINLAVGVYDVMITDANSDTATASFPISNTANIYASVTTTSANCGNNGTADVQVQGAHPPFTFLWSDTLHQTTPTAIGLTGGNYSVTITDSIGCTRIALASVPSGCLNIITGRVYYDANQNCVQDSGEAGLSNKMLYVSPGYYYGSTNASGDFTITTPNTNNTLHAPSNMSPLALTCPSSGTYSINFTSAGDTSTANDFGYWADPNYFDLVLHPGWSTANPGFDKHYWICYYNNSPAPQNVLIRFTYDSLLQYTSCTQGGVNYPVQHKIEWTLNNVTPSNIWDWNTKPEIYFHVPATVSINTMLHSCFEILPIVGDVNPSDNSFCYDETVTGSHDPNSKTVYPAGEGSEGIISPNDSTLLYTIHFQNDGNDTAFTVVVVDTLSPYLDPATVIPGAADHAYTFDLSGQGILTFRFDNILLPDSNANEPESNGYLNFTVKLRKNLPEGTVITNTAANYFDFNAPVNTNTVKNTMSLHLTVAEQLLNNDIIKLFPNPTQDALNIEMLNDVYYPCKLKIYNELSGYIFQTEITKSFSTIYCNNWKSGFYFYTIEDTKGAVISRGKIIVQ